MIKGVDSAYPPSAASVAAAQSDSVKLWSGYLAGPNILHGWTQADFDRVRSLGGTPIAYASGYSPPQTLKAQAAAWNVRLCLDVEGGIRGDGPWVQPWLDASGAGLYGNAPVHNGRRAAFHVLAAYPASGDPHATWSASRLPGPCGWQWHGSISRYGASVDLCWFDDWFAQGDDMTPEQAAQLAAIADYVGPNGLTGQLNAVKAELDEIKALLASGSGSVAHTHPVAATTGPAQG